MLYFCICPPLSNFRPPLRSPQGGAKNRARFARSFFFKFCPPLRFLVWPRLFLNNLKYVYFSSVGAARVPGAVIQPKGCATHVAGSPEPCTPPSGRVHHSVGSADCGGGKCAKPLGHSVSGRRDCRGGGRRSADFKGGNNFCY